MAEAAHRPSAVMTLATGWRRVSPRLVPLMAVITAFLIGIPFMIFTSAKGDVAEGLRVSSSDYSALIEGAKVLVMLYLLSRDNANLIFALDELEDMAARDLNGLARSATELVAAGPENFR